MLLDTNIIIELFKGNAKILELLTKEKNLCISSITVMELYFGAFNKREVNKIKKALSTFNVISIDDSISKKAIDLIEYYAKSHGLMIPDAIIAATALVESVEIMTLNIKDFRFIKELKIFEINHTN